METDNRVNLTIKPKRARVTKAGLLQENAELRSRLKEAQSSLRALRQGLRPSQCLDDYSTELAAAKVALEMETAERKRIENRYHSLFNRMSEGFALCEVVFDSENEPGDLRLLEVNQVIEQLSGLKRADLIGKTIRQVLPQSQLGWIKTCGSVALDGTPVHFERYSDLFRRHYEILAYSPASGTVACLFRDITHRKKAEAALNESRDRMQLAIDSTELGTFDFEPQTGLLVWSEFAQHHFGIPTGGKADCSSFLRAIHPEDRPRMERVFKDVFQHQNGGQFSADYRITSATDSKLRWISARGRVFFDREGRPVRFIGVMLDITQRKRMEQERQELISEFQRQRSLLTAILNQMPDGVTVAEALSGRILLTNDALTRIFGPAVDYERGLECYSQIEAFSKDGRRLLPHEWPLVRTIRNKESIVDEEIRLCPRRVVSVSSRPIYDPAGVMIAAVSFAVDISERQRLEEALRNAQEQLEQKVAQRTAELGRANQVLRIISKCDQTLIQARNEQELIHSICKTIHDCGIYRGVGVCFAEHDEHKTIRPVAAVGVEAKLLQKVRISWGDNELGRGPGGTAIRTGQVCIANDYLSEGSLSAWKKLAAQHGVRSSIALPLKDGSKAFGLLTLYATHPSIFEEQITLLRELADSLSFGIITLRARQDRDDALKRLEQKTSQLRALAAELARVEDKERRRLAQILHDDFQQGLVAARFQITNLRRYDSAAQFQTEIANVDKILQECLETSRSLTSELCPRVLCEPCLGTALQWLGRQFQEKHGLAVKVVTDKTVGVNQEDLRIALFHAVRELLFNTVKHAGVKKARVRLSLAKDGRVRIVVSDQGVGFDPTQIRAKEGLSGGFGLFRLRERIAFFGDLEVKSAPGKGSRFILSARDNGRRLSKG